MMYLLDVCLIIFITFNLLFAIRLKPLEYLRISIIYLAPILILSFIMDPIYQLIISGYPVPELFNKLFNGKAYLMYYLTIKIIGYIILVIVFKLICFFTLNRIIIKQNNLINNKWLNLINIPQALVFSFVFSFWLVFILSRLGISYLESHSYNLYYKTTQLSEIGTLTELSQKYKIYQELNLIEGYLKGEKIDEINKQVAQIFDEISLEINSLKQLLTADSLTLFKPDNIDNIIRFTGDNSAEGFILENEKNNIHLRDIKSSLNRLKKYYEFAGVVKEVKDENPNASGYDIIGQLKEPVTSTKRQFKSRLEALIKAYLTQEGILTYTKSYLVFEGDDVLYQDKIQELLLNQQAYQTFLKTFKDDYYEPTIDYNNLNVIINYPIVENRSLKESYLKNELLKPIVSNLLNNKGFGIIFPLVDDFITQASIEQLTFIKEELKTIFNNHYPSKTFDDYCEWVNNLLLSPNSRTKIIS